MKTLRPLLILLLVIGFTNCKSQNKQEEEKIKYPIEITDNIRKIKDRGWAYEFYLKEPQVIKTYPVNKGIEIAKNGTRMMFYLAENHLINGDTIPKGSKVKMFSVGEPFAYELTKPANIRGYLVSTETLTAMDNILFYEENGNINWFIPEKSNVIDGIPCMAKRSIKFYPSGDLHICALSEDFEYEGEKYLANTMVIFSKNRVINPISEYDVGAGFLPWRIKFYDDGNPKSIMLQSDYLVYGFPCARNSNIFLYPNGSIKECELSKKIEIENNVYKKGEKLMFDEVGNFKTKK